MGDLESEVCPMMAQVTAIHPVLERLSSLFADEDGQDLIEYAVLTSVVAISALLAHDVIAPRMRTAFTSLSEDINALWTPDDPSP